MSTPAAILAVMRASRPRCRDSGDVLAYALHAATMAEGYRLLAAGPAAETPENARTDPNVDPSEGWTAWEGAYAFRYARERAVDAASPSTSNRRAEPEGAPAPPHHEILVKSMVVGDAMLVSALVARVGDAAPFDSPPVRTAEFSLVAHVEPGASCAADAAASLRRVDELAARAAKEIFKPLLVDAGVEDASPGISPGTSARGDAKGADCVVDEYPRRRRSTRRGRTTVARRDGIRRACRRWARGSTRTARQTCPSSPRGVSTADRTSRIIPTRSSEESRDGREAPFPARVGV